MRPVDRGPVPNDDKGNPRTFAQYEQAKWHLRDRLGQFCSYCERQIATHLAVEHIEARATGGAIVDWDNFLLACVNCNSTKGTKPVAGLYFPHTHNTAHAFVYGPGAVIAANPSLPGTEQSLAMETLQLFGLDNLVPSKPSDPADTRYENYVETWERAERSLERLRRKPSGDLRAQIAETACSSGAFSIYMAVFADDPGTRQELLHHFGRYHTRSQCFDADANCIPDLFR